MRIPDHILAQISDRLDMQAVVSEYVHLNKKGTRLWGLCPFHSEKTPSFTVDPDKSLFYCFGCHKGGSLFTFIMEIEKLSFLEAVKLLAEKAGVQLELEEGEGKQREAYLELYRRVSGTFQHLLMNHPEGARARSYLESRGLEQETWSVFNLGYAPAQPAWLHNFLREKKFSDEFLRQSGLFTARQGTALFRGRIIFPIHNHRKEIVAFGARTLGSGVQPKYINSPETEVFRKRETLYGSPGVYQDVRRAETFVLVEGYMDVLALWQAGVRNCVAPLGTAVTAEQIRLLKRYTPRGKLLFDTDEAGQRAAERTILLCEQQDLATEVIRLQRGKDPAEILEKEGAEALKKKLESTITSFQFYLSTAQAKYDSGTPDGKRAVIRHVGSYLTALDSQVKRDGYIRLLAENLGVDFESVRSDLLRGIERSRIRDNSHRKVEVRGTSADLFFILAVAVNREYFQEVRNTVGVDDLEDPKARTLFVALEECYRQGERTEETLLRRLEDEGLRELLLQKTASGEFDLNPERLIHDGLREIRRRSLEKRRRSLVSALSRAKDQDPMKLKDLLGEKMYLDEELQKLAKGLVDE
ncbi:MAG: DNA primase [Spirochaetaceae bacterium]|nr:MAG: DNA primase [Spirochaetaceae bacterium]